ncbi:MAG: hypothetical protein KJ858_01060 [Nanoarchaeota archaeon]|nr:hypothetical protein [Nanoarchaeota archaeon]
MEAVEIQIRWVGGTNVEKICVYTLYTNNYLINQTTIAADGLLMFVYLIIKSANQTL